MLHYYLILFLGSIFVIVALDAFINIFWKKNYTLLKVGKFLGIFLLGVLMLVVTMPSLKYVVLKDYDVVNGKCIIEIDTQGRSSSANFSILNTDKKFTYDDIPDLEAYGKSIPYYCELTITKDHLVEISYKIYDEKTRKLILKSN
ncbi:hypothetical protein [Bacillus sp. B1-b2]|uniref:hypothetical protein n=1 Tax=Bacillus sp. B1-b2 TaxID=2653201 RepID=UPI001262570B|nr:hypothetical protein [Bacillus sp. B1-b2]KAB7667156.1 hypothetical protein F9279_16320 [Bacillus sp. B1-b2]